MTEKSSIGSQHGASAVAFLDLAAAHSELADELEDASRRVLRSGWYVRGPELERFEAEFAAYCGVQGAVGVANGLEALQLMVMAHGIGRGDEVLVPAHTSIATWLAVTHAGARPVPVEPDVATMQIDANRVEAVIGPRTAAIMPVHLYGMPADTRPLAALAQRHGLRLLEDGSQAHGARLAGRRVGALGDAAAFSLYPTKNLGALGDGGIVVADDPALLDRVRTLANYGERGRYDNVVRGFNSRLDELQAALLRIKLRRLDEWNARRSALADRYLEQFDGCADLVVPRATPDAQPVWHQFVVRVDRRDAVRAALERRGVPTLIHYPTPPHRTPAYAPDYPDSLPIAERLAETVLSLPISPQMDPVACAEAGRAVMASVAEASA